MILGGGTKFDKYWMPGEIPFFIDGWVALLYQDLALIKVNNGNIYEITSRTPGINFENLKLETQVRIEITSKLTRVLSASIISDEQSNH